MHDRQFYHPSIRPLPRYDRFPFGVLLLTVVLVSVLVGAAFLAGQREGYALGRYDASQDIVREQ